MDSKSGRGSHVSEGSGQEVARVVEREGGREGGGHDDKGRWGNMEGSSGQQRWSVAGVDSGRGGSELKWKWNSKKKDV